MDVLLNDEEVEIQDATRKFLATACSTELVRASERQPDKCAHDLWAKISELGWISASLPESCGGQNLPLTCLGLMFEELGRHLAPIPMHGTVVCALVLAKYAKSPNVLEDVARGATTLTYAIQECNGAWPPEAFGTKGQHQGDAIVISGTKFFVDGFAAADRVLVVFDELSQNGDSMGTAIALVNTDAPGIDARSTTTIAKDAQSIVAFNNVEIRQEDLVIPAGQGRAALRHLMDIAAAFNTALMVGAAEKTVEMATNYSKERIAFGHPIGAFQAIQHLCADMQIAVDGAKLLVREAIWKLDQNLPASVEVSQAKAFANEKCIMAARSAQQIHGGLGFMIEFDLQLWYRRIVAWSLRCGTVFEHRRQVSHALMHAPENVRLDMPLVLPM
jgi:alkylation response protein AidB-like acyl-CoA dehydrogenase